MKMNRKMSGGFTLVELLVVIVIIAAHAGLTATMVIRQRKKADQTEAVSNARQVGLAMMEFETEYGSYPQGDLGKEINDRTGGSLAPTTISKSNDAFRQLIAAEIAPTEVMFYCKTGYSTKKPDNVSNTAQNALSKGEVGFGYIMNQEEAFTAAGNPGRVLIAAPLDYSGGSITAEKFDREAYDAKAVVLKMDNSVVSLAINKDGKAILSTGGSSGTTTKFLLDGNSDDTVWGKSSPTMKVPDK